MTNSSVVPIVIVGTTTFWQRKQFNLNQLWKTTTISIIYYLKHNYDSMKAHFNNQELSLVTIGIKEKDFITWRFVFRARKMVLLFG